MFGVFAENTKKCRGYKIVKIFGGVLWCDVGGYAAIALCQFFFDGW
jgi:hypothetical protein